jgi:hypothetical protein
LRAWRPGQSGNAHGPSLRTRLKNREQVAFAALDRALASENVAPISGARSYVEATQAASGAAADVVKPNEINACAISSVG